MTLPGGKDEAHSASTSLGATARRTAIVMLVVIGMVVLTLALWKLRLVFALLFAAFTMAAAMRPGVEWLGRRHVSRGFAVILHYLVLIGLVAALLSFVVPKALTQVERAIGNVPTSKSEVQRQAAQAHSLKDKVLVSIEERLTKLPTASHLLSPAIGATRTAFEVLLALFFVLAVGAYWILERDDAVDLVARVLPRPKRKKVRDTWTLIDLRLGAFVRGQFLLITFVSAVLSFAFWLDGLHYWLLVAILAGVLEIVPVIGPVVAGALAIGVGLMSSWQVALGAGVAIFVLRQIQDYLVTPRVMGSAVGLSPLIVIVAVFATGVLLGPFYVLLAIPIASTLATLVQVTLLNVEPTEVAVPTVIFSPSDTEG